MKNAVRNLISPDGILNIHCEKYGRGRSVKPTATISAHRNFSTDGGKNIYLVSGLDYTLVSFWTRPDRPESLPLDRQ